MRIGGKWLRTASACGASLVERLDAVRLGAHRVGPGWRCARCVLERLAALGKLVRPWSPGPLHAWLWWDEFGTLRLLSWWRSARNGSVAIARRYRRRSDAARRGDPGPGSYEAQMTARYGSLAGGVWPPPLSEIVAERVRAELETEQVRVSTYGDPKHGRTYLRIAPEPDASRGRIPFPLLSVWAAPDGEVVRVTGVGTSGKRHLTTVGTHEHAVRNRWVTVGELTGWVEQDPREWEEDE